MSVVSTRPGSYDTPSTVRGDLVRLIIDYRRSYERMTGAEPLFLHVSEAIAKELTAQGFKPGAHVAGMKIIPRTGQCADEAICSRDEQLLAPTVIEIAAPATPERAPAKRARK